MVCHVTAAYIDINLVIGSMQVQAFCMIKFHDVYVCIATHPQNLHVAIQYK